MHHHLETLLWVFFLSVKINLSYKYSTEMNMDIFGSLCWAFFLNIFSFSVFILFYFFKSVQLTIKNVLIMLVMRVSGVFRCNRTLPACLDSCNFRVPSSWPVVCNCIHQVSTIYAVHLLVLS